jgi:hypothetical protein
LGWGTNNQSSASTYALTYQSRNRIQLEAAYRGSWIVAAAVDAIPEDMTRCGIDMAGLDPEEVTSLERDMMRLAIWDRTVRRTVNGRICTAAALAVMLIDGQDFATPLARRDDR